MPQMIRLLLIVTAGSGIGGAARYLIQYYAQSKLSFNFPWGTWAINIIGSFIIGLFFALSEESKFISQEARVFLMAGLCGGFTTFSAFTIENYKLIQNGQATTALLYIVSSVVVGILAIYAGIALVKQFA